MNSLREFDPHIPQKAVAIKVELFRHLVKEHPNELLALCQAQMAVEYNSLKRYKSKLKKAIRAIRPAATRLKVDTQVSNARELLRKVEDLLTDIKVMADVSDEVLQMVLLPLDLPLIKRIQELTEDMNLLVSYLSKRKGIWVYQSQLVQMLAKERLGTLSE